MGVVKEKAVCDSGGVEGGVSEEGEEPIPTSEGVVDDVISCDSRGTEVGLAKTEPGDVDTEAMEHKSGGLVKEGVAGDVGGVTVKERACSSEAEARKTSTKEITGGGCDKEGVVSPPPEEALQMQLEKLAQELLEKWAGLKEVFRIPKRAPAVRREVREGGGGQWKEGKRAYSRLLLTSHADYALRWWRDLSRLLTVPNMKSRRRNSCSLIGERGGVEEGETMTTPLIITNIGTDYLLYAHHCT